MPAMDQFNNTTDATTLGHCLPGLLESAANAHQQHVAILCGEHSVTYEELNRRADKVAQELMNRGIHPGDLVAVALDRSINLVVALIAVLKAGAAYVPIDPALPEKRIAQMMENATPSFLLASSDTRGKVWPEKIQLIDVEEALLENHQVNGGTHYVNTTKSVQVNSDDLAYVMYTSGSTGNPKGVEMSHGALCNLLFSLQHDPGCQPQDRMLAVTTISFDMAFLELFLPLSCGATVVIASTPETKDPGLLIRLIQEHSINMMQCTPMGWQIMLDSGTWPTSVRLEKMLTAGEALSRRLADRLLEHGEALWNLYGPTETSYVTCGRVDSVGPINIGRPIANCQLHVLDDDQITDIPAGQEGELYIGGAPLARGYRKNPSANQARFIDGHRCPERGRLYRTGDRALFDSRGQLMILGRIDDQIKVRGYRIEPGDVESAITAHASVSDAVVISRDQQLICYYIKYNVAGRTCSTTGQDEKLGLSIRLWLTERLPAYMVPALFIELESMPLTANGKVDRKSLLEYTTVLAKPVPGKVEVGSGRELSDKLRRVFVQVLGHDHFSNADNLFEHGLDSLRVVRAQKELNHSGGPKISASVLFEHYTVDRLAQHLLLAGRQQDTSQTQRDYLPVTKEDIAIVGLACRLPGGIETPEEFFKLLDAGEEVISAVPDGRWGVEASSDEPKCTQGGFIPTIDTFDAALFGISPKEARSMDPLQHMMLETSWEAFERAGYPLDRLRESETGVFVGTSSIPAYHGLDPYAVHDTAELDGYMGTGSSSATLSGRISHVFGLHGPCMTIDTACSSSLVSTHQACSALRQGECKLALAAGATLIQNQGLHVEFNRLGGMSPDGRCRAFADDTTGTGWGEGAAVVVLKRLSDAVRDQDIISGVIRGSAINHDGRSAGLTIPSSAAQQRLVRTALAAAGLSSHEIDYVEAHGTGTRLGDSIEGAALSSVFSSGLRQTPLYIGSSKSNLGHTQAAAGLVGVMKVVLSMKHGIMPRTLHVERPTTQIDWEQSSLSLVQAARPWQREGANLRRAGISAFGIGGTNAHFIVEEAPNSFDAPKQTSLPCPQIFILSADTEMALSEQCLKLHDFFIDRKELHHASYLDNVAYSLATTRTHFRRRIAITASTEAELRNKLHSLSMQGVKKSPSAPKPSLSLLLSGQGGQWLGMGKSLANAYPVFRQALEDIAVEFDALHVPLLQYMWAEPNSASANLLNQTQFAQPALFALQVALWSLWQSWGIVPSFVCGHSVGEIAAAHIAGIINLPDACYMVASRGRLMQSVQSRGAMITLQASSTEVEDLIQDIGLAGEVDIAAYNAPEQTVIAGNEDGVSKIETHFKSMQRKTKRLDVSHAFHSRHMDPMLEDFKLVLNTVQFQKPVIPVISSLTGQLTGDGDLQRPEYWLQQVRHAVRFGDCIKTLAALGSDVFLELGPDRSLCSIGAMNMIEECSTDPYPMMSWLGSISPRKELETLHASLGELHTRGITIDWHAYFQPFGCQRVELPTYAFQRKHFRSLRDITKGTRVSAPVKLGDAKSEQPTQRVAFDVNWQTIAIPQSTPAREPKASWGLFFPASESEPWLDRIQVAASTAGLGLQVISRLEDASKLDGVVCLWHFPLADGHDAFARATRLISAEALHILKTAGQISYRKPLVFLTQDGVGTGTSGDQSPTPTVAGLAMSMLWGLTRTARTERADLRFRLVDVNADVVDSVALSSALFTLQDSEVAVRGTDLLVPRMQRVPESPSSARNKMCSRTDGAVVITGGLGGLGQRLAKWLAVKHKVRDLVLISRRGLKSPGAKSLISDLAHLGATATVIAADMADHQCVRSVIDIFNHSSRPLRGVIHAAGVIEPGVISTLTSQMLYSTSAPKVNGAWYLHELTQNMDLDFFVMFSSISGILGMPGLGNYAAANTFMDALAHFRRVRGLPATSIAYGTWAGEGMATGLVENTRTHLSEFGLEPLSAKQGLDSLEQAISRGRAFTVVAGLDFEQMQKYHEQRKESVPSLLRLLLRQTHETSTNQDQSLCQILHEAAPERRKGIILDRVRETVATALGAAKADDIDVERPLQDIGFDSLTAVLLRNHLASMTGLNLGANIAFKYASLQHLSEDLLVQVMDQQEQVLSNGDEHGTKSDVQHDSSSTTASPRLDTNVLLNGCIDPSFSFNNATATPPEARVVLVTGATGFVAAFVVAGLLSRGLRVECLVRGSSPKHAQDRLLEVLQRYGLWKCEYSTLLKAVVGDVARPLLGLTSEEFDALANRVDTIFHSASLVDWMRPLEDYIGPNLVSTHEVLRLSSQGISKVVHYISTVSSLPRHMGIQINPGDSEYGYGTSKYLAERMIAAARWRGAHACIYRLPFVSASHSTGHYRLDRGDFLHGLVSGCLDLGAFPHLETTMAAVMPVDYLADTLLTVMTQDLAKSIGRDFDFLNPCAPKFVDFFKLMGASRSGQQNSQILPFGEWKRRTMEFAAANPKSSLARITPVLDAYDDENAEKMMKTSEVGHFVVGGEKYPAPAFDDEFVQRYLERIGERSD